jgi:hypothetical protein
MLWPHLRGRRAQARPRSPSAGLYGSRRERHHAAFWRPSKRPRSLMQKIEIASAPSWPPSAEVEIEKPAGAGRRDNSGHGGRHLARRINLLHLFQIHFREDSPRNRGFIQTLASHDLTERPMADSPLSSDLLAQTRQAHILPDRAQLAHHAARVRSRPC